MPMPRNERLASEKHFAGSCHGSSKAGNFCRSDMNAMVFNRSNSLVNPPSKHFVKHVRKRVSALFFGKIN